MPTAAARTNDQRTFDDLGTPLHEVTFCIIDLETTGGSPNDCGITEIGAVRTRGGHCLGTFQTLVNPGASIPPEITVLTGITQAMVVPAPRIEQVLPALLEFIGGDDTVVVGHNVRFDLGFLRGALERSGRPRLTHRWVDTVALSRRLLHDEVPNCRLGTLAQRLGLDHQPAHRALDDALATVDLLHVLLERAAGLGVLGLDDLLTLPTIAGHAQAEKLHLTTRLPRAPGVYLFRDAAGRVLYVGKATNLRTRVRSYFSGDRRRKIPQLLRETHRIDHEVCPGPLAAAVREVRLIHELQPRFNRQGKGWQRYAYLKLTLGERFPRLSVVRTPRDDGALYLGPLRSQSSARLVAEAIESAVPLRRCTRRVGRTLRPSPCTPTQLGVATCPCAGTITEVEYAAIVDRVVRGLTVEPELLTRPLRDRMDELAVQERFEEAADVRDRAAALVAALGRQRRLDALRRAGRLVLELPDDGGAELVEGRLIDSWVGTTDRRLPLDPGPPTALTLRSDLGGLAPLPRDLADELACVAGWLDREAGRVRVVHCEGELVEHFPPLPSFEPGRGISIKRDR